MDNRITSLTPATRALAQQLIDACAAAGVPIKLTSTLRTVAEQDALYAQGRTAPGQIVTNLKGGQGIHETGQAFDVIPVNGGYHASQATWDKIGSIGEGLGLEWGGNWKGFKDLPHFQLQGAKPGRPSPGSAPSAQPSLSGVPWTGPIPSESDNVDRATPGTDIFIVQNAPPIPNRLHRYASYIYSLSLHMMTNEEYDNLVVTQEYSAKNVIIASAGRHSANFQRNKNWIEDFYFENFSMKTIISPNDESGNTNAISCNFEIIEPYGFTMVERIIKTTEDLGGSNYLDMPYLVQIDFFAIDDAGEITGAVPELQKRFPIKLNKLGIRITERGAVYDFRASPYGHAAFESTTVTVPANMEVTSRTIVDFFKSSEDTSVGGLNQAIQQFDTNQRESTSPSTGTPATLNADSFGTAINAYYKGLKDAGKIAIADVYRFEFLPDPDTGQDILGTATFIEDKRNTPKETPMKKNESIKDAVSMRMADIGSSQNTYDTSRGIFSINYGTTIDKLLEYVIRNSSYIHDQLVLPDGISNEEYKARKDAMKDKPLKWFRIIPKVRPLGFDKIRKIQAKEVTYTVKPYKMYNLRSDIAPQGTVVTPVKAYNYFFTGKNSDIIHLDIVFNTLYYTQQTAYRSSMASQNPTGDSITTNYEFQNAPNYSGGDAPKGINYDAVMPLVMKPVVQNSKAVATGNPSTAKEVGAADLADSIMSSSEADMLRVKMTIIGDPDYIKQDDIFYGADTSNSLRVSSEIDKRLLPDGGSLVMDDGSLYVQVLFKVPRDIDDSTGFMKYDAGERNSVFSGLYQVLSVTSTFAKGQFTQELTMTRIPRQVAFDYVSRNNNQSAERPGSATVAATPVQQAPNPPTTDTATATDTAGDQIPGQEQAAPIANNTEAAPSTQQQDLAAVRAAGVATDINNQNAPVAVSPLPVPTEADNNAQFLGKAKVIAQQVKDLVMQRDSVYNSYRSTDSGLTRVEDQLIADDPANADLSEKELAAKSQEYATLLARKQNLLAQQKSLNQQIVDTANSIPALGFSMNATIQSSVQFNTTARGPNPSIVVGGQTILEQQY
jgi:hypothetical protein